MAIRYSICILNSQDNALQNMTNELNLILNQIGDELDNQISLATNVDEKIDMNKLAKQSKILDEAITSSKISDENKSMLQQFLANLIQGNTTVKSLRYEKQDLVRVQSNLNNF